MDTFSSLMLLVFLTVLNGIFTAAELSVTSSKNFRLDQSQSKGANFAKRLKTNPTIFLSTVQIGITVVVVMTGSLGEETLSHIFNPYITQWVSPDMAKTVLNVLVFSVITFFTVLFGELIPKSIALHYPEVVASKLAPIMYYVSKFASPVVYIFSQATKGFLFLLGMKEQNENVSEEDVIGMMDEGAQSGAIEQHDREIVERVFELDDQKVHRIMTPRTEWVDIDVEMSRDEIRSILHNKQYGRYPVRHDGEYIGIISVHNLMQWIENPDLKLEDRVVEPHFIPNMIDLKTVLENFRVEGSSYFIVIDEYSQWQGMISRYDMMRAIVGDIPDRRDAVEQKITQDPNHSNEYYVDASVAIHEFKEFFDITWNFPDEDQHSYLTIGGFMMFALGRVPKETDAYNHENYQFVVIDMDKQKVDKLKVVVLSI